MKNGTRLCHSFSFTLHLPLDFIRVSSLRPTYLIFCTHSIDSSPADGEFPCLRSALVRLFNLRKLFLVRLNGPSSWGLYRPQVARLAAEPQTGVNPLNYHT